MIERHEDALTALQQKYNCRLRNADLMAAFCQPENNQGSLRNEIRHDISCAVAAMASAPAYAQNPFMDRAKEAAARRAENEAVRQAEHPQAANQTAAAKPPRPRRRLRKLRPPRRQRPRRPPRRRSQRSKDS